MASTSNDLLRRLARLGAIRRIQQLQEEAKQILQQFPDLREGQTPAGSGSEPSEPAGGGARKRKRPKMTAAQRQAVGERMKKYWAERRSAAKK